MSANPSAPDIRQLLPAAALGLVDLRDAEECLARCAAVVVAVRAGRLTEHEFVAAALAAMEPMQAALGRAIALLEPAANPSLRPPPKTLDAGGKHDGE